MKPSLAVPIAIVAGGIIVAVAVFMSMAQPAPTDGSKGKPELVRAVDTTDHILGNPAAPIKIIEYSDYYCEFCKNFDDTMHQLIANEGAGGKVAWVYRHFPLTEIHPNAFKAARAAECAAQAGGNDAFWKFSASLFKNQPTDPSKFGALASEAGIAGDAFSSCYSGSSTDIDARIQSDRKNVVDMGARGTPFSVLLVEGSAPVVLDGAYSYEALKQIIEQAI